jgi:hypothetical protein
MRLPWPAGWSDILREARPGAFAIPVGKGTGANESGCLRQVRATGRPAAHRGGAAGTQTGRGPCQGLATTVNRTDTGVRQGAPFFSRFISGFPRPRWKILGTELAGEVEAAGPAVTEFTAGDQVFGVNAWRFGAHAEFVCMRESAALAHKPAGMSFEEAVGVCDGAILALGA